MVYQGQNQNATSGSRTTEFPMTDTREMHTLMECLSICLACSKKCIEEGHKKTASLCADCAKACDFALQLTCCQSEFQNQALDLCTQVCKRCADECNKVQSKHCQECAQACKRCAEACSNLAFSYRH